MSALDPHFAVDTPWIAVYRARAGKHATAVLDALSSAGCTPRELCEIDGDPPRSFWCCEGYTVRIGVPADQAARAAEALRVWEALQGRRMRPATRRLRKVFVGCVLVLLLGVLVAAYAPPIAAIGLAGLVVLTGAWGIRRELRRMKRFPAGHCPRCGYDLRGNVSGRCPECGKRIKRRKIAGVEPT